MNNILSRKNAGTFVGVILSLTTIQVESAQAASVSWDLTFFDNSGQLVGTGAFSYDPERTQTISDRGRPPQTLTVTGILETFSANVGPLQWSQGDFRNRNLWWVPNNSIATRGESISSRFGTFFGDSWQLEENDSPSEAPFSTLILSGSSTQLSGEGSWTQRQSIPQTNSTGAIINYQFVQTQGTWTAVEQNTRSIPEGSLVFALAGFAATTFSRKLSRLAS